MADQEFTPQADRWYALVTKVEKLEQLINWQIQRNADYGLSTDAQLKEARMLIESIRRSDLEDYREALEGKLDKASFIEFKTEHFVPVKTTVEAINHFKSRVLILGTTLLIVVPALLQLAVKKLIG